MQHFLHLFGSADRYIYFFEHLQSKENDAEFYDVSVLKNISSLYQVS